MRKALVYFLLSAGYLSAKQDPLPPAEVHVDLRSPVYRSGILYTNQGGVINSADLRIQARTIQYIRREEGGKSVHRIEAEGDLMIQYKGRIYVGSELEYDFDTRSGVVYDGKTFPSMWYIGGDQIQLGSDGSYKVTNAFITTCENSDSSWDIHAGKIDVLKNDMLSAKKVRFRLFRIPTFWLPSFKINLKKFKEPVFRYSVKWDSGHGPRAMMRYQLYSWQEFALYGRLQYQWGKGFGGAVETEYLPENKRISFVTRSFLGNEVLDNADEAYRRYRVQGAYNYASENEKTTASLTWDKYSDVRMPGDFKSEDFEVNTAKKTQLFIYHKEADLIASFKVRPRVNPFESIKQDLPSLFATVHPIELWNTGVISTSWLKISYMDFAYSNQLEPPSGEPNILRDFRSARLELQEKLYRPFHLGPLVITPQIGAHGIYYSNSPSHDPKALGVLNYGGRVHARGYSDFSRYKHVMEPYLEYSASTRPTVSPSEHYIFTIRDGLQKINQIQVGIRQLLVSNRRPGCEPSFTADAYINAFFSDPVIPQFIPRAYLWLAWRLPSIHLTFQNAWNFENHIWDYSKARCKWTVNEDIALSFEARYRSRYDWRKADHENFILDVTRSEDELLLSPLSDRRITLLADLFIRINPFWECRIHSHHGFYRITGGEPKAPYNEIKFDLYTWISSAWKLRMSYGYSTKSPHNHFGANLILIKK